ncbi:type 1 glutamine amidotransferase domain-containing protein [Candidatus Marimicrobium litorale]|uniref:Type 1 glutamine amidotransferase domain-containing protein n=1 Tax=Candidatus Marimicrobium litorale TaxID=2518991 RepID=A0ABT3TB22_9GAMM|nr:type 1 glutamine amidotransferase domain-containing protein [Candidatus Marimicrobium litorale]MCX2979234.1 type 1 glutamine amidotransferase domain-containing protein [Candidatus Marimicrobium litorale]
MKSTLLKGGAAIIAIFAVFILSLPTIMHQAGLHPEYTGETHQLPAGMRALIVTTSHGVLNAAGETTGDPTGIALSELTHPYYSFLDAGMQIEVASIKGGQIPVDPSGLGRVMISPEDKRYLNDPILLAKVENSLNIDNVDFTAYDAIFLVGGWGAAYDLGYSEVLAQQISEAYYGAKAPLMGSVCHGALGFINVKDLGGNKLIAGRAMSGVTDKQVKELGIELTPMHPETELRKAGAVFESQTAFRDVFATHVAIDAEQRFITGQNQNSGMETAQKMIAIMVRK